MVAVARSPNQGETPNSFSMSAIIGCVRPRLPHLSRSCFRRALAARSPLFDVTESKGRGRVLVSQTD
jgi:hypothetical protein